MVYFYHMQKKQKNAEALTRGLSNIAMMFLNGSFEKGHKKAWFVWMNSS